MVEQTPPKQGEMAGLPGLWGRSIAGSNRDGPALVAKLKVSTAGKTVGFGKNNFWELT